MKSVTFIQVLIKKASLLICDEDRFANYKNLLARKNIIKDGIVFNNYNNTAPYSFTTALQLCQTTV